MTEIILHAEPGVVVTWDDFQATKPPYSIALDGYASGQTNYTPAGPFASFNHHEDVDRLATRSTCMQIYFSIVLGLFDAFKKDGKRFAHVFVNDADQDVCLSYWLLTHPEMARSMTWGEPLAKLVVLEDFLDASGGAYPYDDSNDPISLLTQQAWVFEPYTNAREERRLHSMNGAALTALINEVSARISLFAENKGQSVAFDTKPFIIGGGPGWKMIVEKSGYTRTSIYDSGIGAFVGMRERNDGNYTYVLGKMSPYIPFPLEQLYETLNTLENLDSIDNRWGGSDIIGGSPRKTGSRLSPQQIEEIINKVIMDN
jgi:hypothetical protein